VKRNLPSPEYHSYKVDSHSKKILVLVYYFYKYLILFNIPIVNMRLKRQTIEVTYMKNNSNDLKKLVGESEIFYTIDDANWAFDFIHDMVTKLNILGPGDGRLAITYRRDREAIHLNYCSWLLVRFYKDKHNETCISLPFTESSELDKFISDLPFAKGNAARSVRLYSMSIVDVQSLPKTLEENFEDTIEYINKIFQNQKRSQYRIYNWGQLEGDF
jgi:hypothetical protein